MRREEAIAIYRAGKEAVVRVLCAQSKAVRCLQEKVKKLEITVARLSKNSSNSSKPPSSDDITKPKPKNEDGKKRNIGAQPGHSRNERSPFPKEDIDNCVTVHGVARQQALPPFVKGGHMKAVNVSVN